MTDKNYNDIDIFDIKDIKTCEQVITEYTDNNFEYSDRIFSFMNKK